MKRLPNNPLPISLPGCYLAGGSILSVVTKSEIADYDIYPKSKQSMISCFYHLQDSNCFVVNVSDRAVTWKCNDVMNDKGERAIIQVMTFNEFDTPEKIFEFFDFSVCMAAFDTDTSEYHFHSDFWPSVASKTLHFNPKTKFPLNSAIRVGKYTSKGYYLPRSESIKMSLAVINAGMPSSWKQLEAAIGGTYGRQIQLSVGDKEFSYENALEVLDNFVLDLSAIDTLDDFSCVRAEHLESLFAGEKLQVLTIESKNSWSSTSIFNSCTLANGILSNLTADEKKSLVLIGAELEPIDPDVVLYGYKSLKAKDDGGYENTIHRKKIDYRVGHTTTEHGSPYIYMWPSLERARKEAKAGTVIGKFEFKAKDVKVVYSNEYQVSEAHFLATVNP